MSTFFTSDPREERRRTMNALGAVFQRTDQMLTGKPVRVRVVEDARMPHAAWTQQDNTDRQSVIHFNLEKIGGLNTPEDIVRITGLNIHEVSHVMFTPHIPMMGRGNPMADVIRTLPRGMDAFNILEDQRIETMMVLTFPSSRHYFNAAISDYILNGSDEQLMSAWMLVHGRRYVGDDLREALRKLFIAPDVLPELERIIDDYRTLDLYMRGDLFHGSKLVNRFHELVFGGDMENPPQYAHSDQHMTGEPTSEDKAAASNASAKVKAGKDETDDRSGEPEDQEGNGDQSSGGEEGDQDDEQDGEGGSSGNKDADDTDLGDDDDGSGSGEEGDEEQDAQGKPGGSRGSDAASGADGDKKRSAGRGSGGKGAGDGGPKTDTSILNKARDIASNLLDEALNDEGIVNETRTTQRAAKYAPHHDTIEIHRGWHHEARPEPALIAQRFAVRLGRMRDEVDPGWERHQPEGRINVQRAMHGDPLGDVWDTWTEGKQDATDIEIVMAVDVSGSMGSHVYSLSNAAWIIKAASDRLGMPCTVYAFDHGGFLVYKADEKAVPDRYPNTPATGGTAPHRIIIECARVLTRSRRKKKLLIMMSDGAWAGHPLAGYPTSDEIIKQLNASGVVTAMYYLTGNERSQVNWHHAMVRKSASSLDALPAFADMLVRALMQM